MLLAHTDIVYRFFGLPWIFSLYILFFPLASVFRSGWIRIKRKAFHKNKWILFQMVSIHSDPNFCSLLRIITVDKIQNIPIQIKFKRWHFQKHSFFICRLSTEVNYIKNHFSTWTKFVIFGYDVLDEILIIDFQSNSKPKLPLIKEILIETLISVRSIHILPQLFHIFIDCWNARDFRLL